MTLSGSTGSFQLSILGYGLKSATWRDRNELNCQVSTSWLTQRDSQAAPLKTWEIRRLLSGLKSLCGRVANHTIVTFGGSGLSLEDKALPNEEYQVRIQLDHTLTPAWHEYPDFPLEMDMTLNRKQLQEAITDLTAQLAHYPER